MPLASWQKVADGLSAAFELDQNFPNPFNSGTVIRFALPSAQRVELAIFNAAGQKVAALLEGDRQPGTYSINWDGRDDGGYELASGMYFYRLTTQVKTRKLLLTLWLH